MLALLALLAVPRRKFDRPDIVISAVADVVAAVRTPAVR
jgi:hypothetical protein